MCASAVFCVSGIGLVRQCAELYAREDTDWHRGWLAYVAAYDAHVYPDDG